MKSTNVPKDRRRIIWKPGVIVKVYTNDSRTILVEIIKEGAFNKVFEGRVIQSEEKSGTLVKNTVNTRFVKSNFEYYQEELYQIY